jgi:hypothetical protein
MEVGGQIHVSAPLPDIASKSLVSIGYEVTWTQNLSKYSGKEKNAYPSQ